VQAPTPFGIEAQFSTITQRDAKSRTSGSFHGGWPPLWLPGSLKVASQIGHYVPQLRHNDTEIDWHTMPSKGTASATSIKRIRAGHCTVTGPFDHCPNRRGGFCGQWHPWFNEPALGWTLDAGGTVSAQVPWSSTKMRRGLCAWWPPTTYPSISS
jgi:hypothetical protein